MNYEINHELVVSTAHISKIASKKLNEMVENKILDETRYGWRIWTCSDDNPFTYFKDCPEIVALIKLAKKHDCKWLLLDQDAKIYDDLPQFEWE